MFINDYLPLKALLEWMDELSPKLESKYRVRSSLIPRWKNFFTFQVDRFDRYPEMITHGSTHICNVLALAAEFLAPGFKPSQKEDFPLSGEELFLLIAAIFLHDIGMADVARRSYRPDEVRKKHSVLSGEIIRGRFRRGQSYANLLPSFTDNDEVDVLAEICIHHQSKAPIARSDRRQGNTAPTLEELCDLHDHLGVFNGKSIDIKAVTALLRVLDACDVQYSRAGSVFITESKVKNNQRLREECRVQETQSRDELKTFYHEYGKYLAAQEAEHFPKHSVIQKVWILDGQVVYRPLSYTERRLLCSVLPDAALRPEAFYRRFEAEIEKELAVCNGYLAKKGLAIHGVRQFDPETDPIKIARLPTYRREWNPRPALVSPYLPRDPWEADLAEGFRAEQAAGNPFLFIGPEGIGKTWLAKTLARKTQNSHRVCFIPLEGFWEKSADESLREIVIRITYFLAAWGDYLFYNKIRMEMEMEEAQWEILLEQADRTEHLFVFDDFHLLPLQRESAPLFRFMRLLFQRLKQARIAIFSQKIPHPLSAEDGKNYELREIPPFTDAQISRMLQGQSYLGFAPEKWPEGVDAARSLLKRYRDLPVVLDRIREEADHLPPSGPESAQWLKESVARRMDYHLRGIRADLENEAQAVLERMVRYPLASQTDPRKLTRWWQLEPTRVQAGLDQLYARNLLHRDWLIRPGWAACLWETDLADPGEQAKIFNVIAELRDLEGLDQGEHHHLDAWQHSLAVLKHLRAFLLDPDENLDGLPFPLFPDILLLAGLLHDLGKPSARKESEKGIGFIGHESQGADMARPIGVRLGLKAEELQALDCLIRHHMRPLHLIQDWPRSRKGLLRFAKETGAHASDILLLSKADLMASGKTAGERQKNLSLLNEIILESLRIEKNLRAKPKPTFLNGTDLKELGLPSGPIYGEILEEAKDAELLGEIHSREQALDWLRQRAESGE